MTGWTAVKAADLREGDTGRWTDNWCVRRRNVGDLAICWSDGIERPLSPGTNATLDAGTLERQERPLDVGDPVRFSTNPVTARGEIIHVSDGKAWVRWVDYDEVTDMASLLRVRS